MFDLLGLGMLDNYEERKIDCYKDEKTGLCVDTCMVTDSEKDYETGIEHPQYNDGDWVIVELYDTKEKAQEEHNIWVKRMTGKKLPEQLKDVSTAEIAKLRDIGGKDWRKYKSQKGE